MDHASSLLRKIELLKNKLKSSKLYLIEIDLPSNITVNGARRKIEESVKINIGAKGVKVKYLGIKTNGEPHV